MAGRVHAVRAVELTSIVIKPLLQTGALASLRRALQSTGQHAHMNCTPAPIGTPTCVFMCMTLYTKNILTCTRPCLNQSGAGFWLRFRFCIGNHKVLVTSAPGSSSLLGRIESYKLCLSPTGALEHAVGRWNPCASVKLGRWSMPWGAGIRAPH